MRSIEEPSAVFVIAESEAGLRLDHFLTGRFPDQSRSFIGKLINGALVRVDDRSVKPGHRLHGGERIEVRLPPPPSSRLVPEQVDFTVLFEDDHLLVISKPPGLVVHPAGGHVRGTLVHGLLHHCRELPAGEAGRPGIVHRLDKDTSGVMLVAKTELALRALTGDFKERKIEKIYHALLLRCPREPAGRIVAAIGRHPVDRKKMAVRPRQGRFAATSWQVKETFANGWCLAEIGIETGRTHQIRVHTASIRCPVVGDATYGGGLDRQAPLRPLRQMLHASVLRFRHPVSGQALGFTAPLWEDMEGVLATLRQEWACPGSLA